MGIVSDIFAACDAADVRLWREGDRLRFKASAGMPAALAEMLKAHKADVLACLPDGFGWHRGGAMRHKPPDFPGACRFMADRLGWPKVSFEHPTGRVIPVTVQAGQQAWERFTAGAEECSIAAAMLELEPLWLARKRGAA